MKNAALNNRVDLMQEKVSAKLVQLSLKLLADL